jgi:DNA primase
VNIVDLIQQDVRLKHVSSTGGGEYAGACPWCGGNDRFHVWPEGGNYWCRQCNRKGDAIQYLIDFRGATFQEAAKAIGKELAPPKPRNDSPLFVAARALLALEDEYTDFQAQWVTTRAKLTEMANLPHQHSDEHKTATVERLLLLLDWESTLSGLETEIWTRCDALL